MTPSPMARPNDGADLRELVSSLMDGELDADRRRHCLDRLCTSDAACAEWAVWHAVGDALRSSEVGALHAQGFADRLAVRLAQEPAIVAPRARTANLRMIRRVVMPGAAAVAAVAVLAVVAVPMMREAETGRVEIARVQGASQPVGATIPVVASVARQPVTPLLRRGSPVDPERFDLYLTAHGQMSGAIGMPRTSQYLRQGVSDHETGR